MRSKISSRLTPVIVRPWFLRPTTQRAGSSASRTKSATALPSSRVPQGKLKSVDGMPSIQPWT